MIGNDRVRFCEHCQLKVHNVDFASKKQIKRLIARSRGRLCVNYLTPVPQKPLSPILYKIGRRTSVIAASAFSATLGISSVVAAGANLKQTVLRQETSYAASVANPVSATSGVGRLYGFVYDPSGGAVNGASLSLVNSETGESYYSITSGNGQYQIEGVTPGTYLLTVIVKGFDTSNVPNLVIRAGDNNRLDQTLSIAAAEPEEPNVTERFVRTGGAVAVATPTDPLVQAASDDNLEAVQLILLSRSDADARDADSQYTALERAVQNGNRDIVQVLLWAKADVNARDRGGQTVLMQLGEDTTTEIVWDLINAGAKINLRDNDGDTALISNADEDNVEALKGLLDAGAKVNEANNEGQTALMIAAENGLVHNVRALIHAGANVNAKDKEGRTALMYAQEDDHKAVIRLLKAHGAVEFDAPQKQ
jgi:hypothetical protein